MGTVAIRRAWWRFVARLADRLKLHGLERRALARVYSCGFVFTDEMYINPVDQAIHEAKHELPLMQGLPGKGKTFWTKLFTQEQAETIQRAFGKRKVS